MNKEITRTLALAALAIIIKRESEIDELAAEVKVQREKLDKLMISLNQERLEGDEFEALRYPSTGYEIDSDALAKMLRRASDGEAFDLLMPRTPAAANIRKVIDGKMLPRLQKPVRDCCTKHVDWKLKVQKAKRKAVAVGDAACAAG